MKVLIASMGAHGHLNPLLGIAGILTRHCHEVLVFAAPELQRSVEAAGLSFLAEPPEAKSFISHFLAKYPERDQKEPGMEMIRFDVQFLFGGNMAMQAAGLDLALREFPADVIVADTGFLRLFGQ
jgi:UDP:flavonoid glycosyltransferase YjiC (YdhE family)